MPRVTRATAKARTRQRLLDEAQRLFRERGYSATSLEQIAVAAEVTKGAIYGHFSSKEDLLLSAIEAAPTPDYGQLLDDQSVPLPERLRAFGRAMAHDEDANDRANLAAGLEFLAAVLRTPEHRRRYAADVRRRLEELAAADDDQPRADTTSVEVWGIGHALFLGLAIHRAIDPELYSPDVFSSAAELLTGLHEEAGGAGPVRPGSSRTPTRRSR